GAEVVGGLRIGDGPEVEAGAVRRAEHVPAEEARGVGGGDGLVGVDAASAEAGAASAREAAAAGHAAAAAGGAGVARGAVGRGAGRQRGGGRGRAGSPARSPPVETGRGSAEPRHTGRRGGCGRERARVATAPPRGPRRGLRAPRWRGGGQRGRRCFWTFPVS